MNSGFNINENSCSQIDTISNCVDFLKWPKERGHRFDRLIIDVLSFYNVELLEIDSIRAQGKADRFLEKTNSP